MSNDEVERLRCMFCAEPLMVLNDQYVHDYPAIGIKLTQVGTEAKQIDAVFSMMARCTAAHKGNEVKPIPQRQTSFRRWNTVTRNSSTLSWRRTS